MAKGVSVDLIVDPKKAIAGLNQVEGKANSVTDTLGKLGKIAAGAVTAVAVAGVAGAATLGAAVVKAYSEYEQLAGGVTKLFGEADAEVMRFAQNAATSAGLSTNAYLSTVTSFSASLIAGLNGDQVAAAKSADQAITDMADNANTFGTSVESLQIAYQGFAKGNFALLDNLKLGYGGSQEGMAKLINDSGVLGDTLKVTAQTVKDVPFDKMVEAIHRVQESMGIAGTTAREAATTIEGSFNATKASLQNLVAGLGTADADFNTLVGNLTTNAQNLINNVVPVIGRLAEAIPMVVPLLISALQGALPALVPLAANLVGAILTGIVETAPALIEGAIPVVLNFVAGIVKMLPDILDAGIQVLIALVQGIAAALPTLIPTAVTAVVGLVRALIDNLPLLLNAGLQLLTGLITGIISALPILIAALPKIIVGIIKFLINAIPTLIDAGLQLFLALVGALPDIITGIVEAIPQIIVGLLTALIAAYPKLIEAGFKLLVSLIANLPQIIITLVKAIPDIVQGIAKAFSDPKNLAALGEAGMELITGLWEGIQKAGPWLLKKLGDFFGGMVDTVKDIFGIRSPSTVFAGIGDNIVLGLVGGIDGKSGLLNTTMNDLSRQVTGGFGAAVSVQARASVASTYGTGATAGTVTAAPGITQNVYVRPEDDPRVVGRQLGREFARMMAGTPA